MITSSKVKKLSFITEKIYLRHKSSLLFHGWHHINFVRIQAKRFARYLGADALLTESAAIVHDLNYLVKVNSKPSAGLKLRKRLLLNAGYATEDISNIEKIINEPHAAARRRINISKEGMAFNDADTLFKALPITPIIFANKYLSENRVDIQKLASQIVRVQRPLLKRGIYFYTPVAKRRYLSWAKTNLSLWENVLEALKDRDVKKLLADAAKLGVL